MLPPDLTARLRQLLTITGDGNVVGNDNTVTVVKQQAGDYAIQIGEIHLHRTFSLDELRQVLIPAGDSSPRLPPHIRRLHWLIGRDTEKQALLDQVAQTRAGGVGHTIFLVGPRASGRHALCDWLHTTLASEDWATVAVRFWDPHAVQEQENIRRYWDTPAMDTYGDRLLDRFPSLERDLASAPQLNAMAQLVQVAGVPLAQLDLPANPLYALNQLTRRVARRQPLIWIIEYLDWADTAWQSIIHNWAREIQGDKRPVLLLVTLDQPKVAQSPAPINAPIGLVDEVTRCDWGSSYTLSPVPAEEVVAALTPADPDLGQDLYHLVTGVLWDRQTWVHLSHLAPGDLWVVQTIWDHWVRERAVELDDQDYWRRSGTWQAVFGDMWDHADAQLHQAIGQAASRSFDVPFNPDRAHEILQCAALEADAGEGIFTAEAIAGALDVDRDALIDFCDDVLVEAPSPILVDLGLFSLSSQRAICRYCFARPYLHLTWLKSQRLNVTQSSLLSRDLAGELESLYYPLNHLIAPKLYDLFLNAGQPDRADRYRRRRPIQPTLVNQLDHVQYLIQVTSDDDTFGTYRLFDVGFSLCNNLQSHPHLWQRSQQIAQELLRRAQLPHIDDREYQVNACYFQAYFLSFGRQLSPALAFAHQAVDLCESFSLPRTTLARSLYILGVVLRDQADYAAARLALERALEITEAAYGPDHPDVAFTLNQLGVVLRDQADYAAARSALERALEITEAAYGPDHPSVASTLHALGVVLRDQADYAAARSALECALEITEAAYGPDHPDVAFTLHALGVVLRYQADYAAARSALECALKIRETVLGQEHPHTGRTRHQLGLVAQATGKTPQAREYLEEALEILQNRLPPDHPHVQQVQNDLDNLDHPTQSSTEEQSQ